jgi:hypothetical protein
VTLPHEDAVVLRADPKAKNDYSDTALSAVAGIGWVEGNYDHSSEESLEVAKMLLDLGLDRIPRIATCALLDGRGTG